MPLSIPMGAVRGFPCIRGQVTAASPGTLEIFLPSLLNDGAFEEGRSIEVPLIAGTQDVRLVLPDYVAGRSIEIRGDTGDSPIRLSGFAAGFLAEQAAD